MTLEPRRPKCKESSPYSAQWVEWAGPDDDTKVLYPELLPSLVSRVGTVEKG